MPVMPEESRWIIKRGAADPTSGSLQLVRGTRVVPDEASPCAGRAGGFTELMQFLAQAALLYMLFNLLIPHDWGETTSLFADVKCCLTVDSSPP